MATSSRVLPWRRQNTTIAEELSPLLTAYKSRHPKGSVSLINTAYEMARSAHANQNRSSGELYINHPIAVARIVADIGLDEVSIVAALLHDAVEDTEITISDVESNFGSEVSAIVDGVTKLERLQFDSKEAQQAATMRKMLVAMARDLRVLMIKLADRLHNMRTIAAVPHEKQQRVAQETLDIYAPLAHRLGMQEIKQQLEDLAFAALYPKRYAELDHLVATRAPERNVYLAKTIGQVQQWLKEVKINAELTARGKHLWSIYEKMVQKGREFDDIYDLLAIRIVVQSEKDCYTVLGAIHGHWKPIVGRFKDYIAMPKFNLYQSLHTTVVGPGGKPIEVQIRTQEMHQRAEWGVASHWAYKDTVTEGDIDWLNRIIDWQGEVSDPSQFLEILKTDLEQDELFVFTPKGRVITLPVLSTPVDFAYAVHTEVGHSCMGARVNGRLVPLDYKLASGDTCEILVSQGETSEPTEDWLEFVVSPKARSKIKQWLTRERLEDLVENGRDELVERLRQAGLPAQKILSSQVLQDEVALLSFESVNEFFAAIGDQRVDAVATVERMSKRMRDGLQPDQLSMSSVGGNVSSVNQKNGVHIEGMPDVLVRLSRCCTPVPPDEVTGFVTKGRGVTVHRADCANATALAEDSARVVDVEWSSDGSSTMFIAAVEVKALDRSRLLRDVANALSDEHVNIVACTTHTGSDRVARMRFEFEFADPSHLQSVLRVIKRIDGVYDANRVLPVVASVSLDAEDIAHPSASR
ncbi:MAG: bifunctional (p)ppGpp synthetase/guanosine-3',5'-bis(diphosphate) 3'-pyrophosphohydrolase [Ilumatobacteraceae bacterium]|jgi:GTP diphosphokinase / guanosine-3',5'-bis(diphosphate) 3'-diphosphatase|nr:MAG: GTP pyrophosphokinase [Acidimicrobium sp. BACL27 MAG-120823-bin4]MDA2963772.1 bifunctional (p)ppGpp synthetase/guanosine-3',5'-bis(diphosphate) 3'-pyrophosphohydrolase [Actinomycetota bacterium]MDP4635728.1 bifunctional (p)ppGpp synthetase/guanosine-3',5'-bis(diphosphate) 3'-pyrophosphohydrolase [Ilumatobacteraceae bacterium]MDA2982560.1 bifunctional (p)ppGpp synthetase/guanosine-3',5'-bis(diphosphate) 3'-pyrophosphohydrolase [Actinomycetota bacterium]MDP4695140.1 bifunctional (p)ppGpp 